MRAATLDEWWEQGERSRLAWNGTQHDIFVHVSGAGPWVTLLHGFPSSSWDWSACAARLAWGARVLACDLLGFGASDKPRQRYSLFAQADLVEALWRRQGVTRTALVAHDYGASVALELLARDREGRLAVRIESAVLLNAGLYVEDYRPRPVQRLLRVPLVGTLVALGLNERRFARSFAAVFAPEHRPSPAELRQHWRAVSRARGARRAARLAAYIGERWRQRARWEGALESWPGELGFVWGLRDPVSGEPMARRLRQRRPQAPFLALEDVGHYPQLEAPERTAETLWRWLRLQAAAPGG